MRRKNNWKVVRHDSQFEPTVCVNLIVEALLVKKVAVGWLEFKKWKNICPITTWITGVTVVGVSLRRGL